MAFENRAQAAQLLATRLESYRGKRPLILAIPRGGVPIGRALAGALGGDLDVTLVHHLRSPDNREFVIGSIHENGHVHIHAAARRLGVGERSLQEEASVQLQALHRRRELYTPGRTGLDPAGRIVIVVDDSAVTGITILDALRAVRARKPRRLIVAVPVAGLESLGPVTSMADKLVCVVMSEGARDVASFYADFPPVSEEEAVGHLTVAEAERLALT